MAARAAATGPEPAAEAAAKRRTLGGLPWIVVYVDHLRHPKAVELAHELKDPRAPLHLAAVWCYFAEHWPEGTMPARPALVASLEAAALWQGESGVLVTAMLRVGFLERRRSRLAVHDWEVYQRAHVERRARDRAYQRRKRARANDELKSSSPQKEPPETPKPSETKEKARPDVGTTSPFASPSPSRSPSPSESRASASDGRRSEPSQSATSQKGNGLLSAGERAGVFDDEEAQAVLRLLPAKAVDIATTLGLPPGAVDDALEDFRRRGLVRLRGGLVPLWELAP